MDNIGTISRGIKAPIITKGDNLIDIVVDSVMRASKENGFLLNDNDIVAVTESVLARAQGNYCTVDDIAQDVKNKFNTDTIGVIFPILSRNRFAICLKGIARGMNKIYLMLKYPYDEVGNHLFQEELLYNSNINPYMDVLNEELYRKTFGSNVHQFTGVDYVSYYKSIIEKENCQCELIFSNNPRTILDYTNNILDCTLHDRYINENILYQDATNDKGDLIRGAKLLLGLDDIMTKPINDSGYNEQYGLLGSNKATENSVKLFPNKCFDFVYQLQDKFYKCTGKHFECMIYGDGAFKDPVGKIWELADPVVSPGFTEGLIGIPNELKLKYLADNDFSTLRGEELQKAIKQCIKNKDNDLIGDMASQGTTPRKYTDLIGSLCDLTSGSGDKGTPIV